MPEDEMEGQQAPDGDRPGADEHLSRVLLVSADRELEALVRATLVGRGQEMLVSATAGGARTALDEQHVDLVVLDLALPDGDGRALLRRLRERSGTATVPVIVVGTAASSRTRSRTGRTATTWCRSSLRTRYGCRSSSGSCSSTRS